MRATVRATGGIVTQPVDAYVVIRTPAGSVVSLQLDGRLRPGLAPLDSNVVVPTGSASFAFPITPAVPPGVYQWIAGLTAPGTLTLTWPLVFLPFSISP